MEEDLIKMEIKKMITLVNQIKNHLLKNHDVKSKSSFLLPLLLHVRGKYLTHPWPASLLH